MRSDKIFLVLILSVLFVNFVSSAGFGYNNFKQSGTGNIKLYINQTTTNYSTVNTNNSQYLQGYTPSQVAGLSGWFHDTVNHIIYTIDSTEKICIGSGCLINPFYKVTIEGGLNITGNLVMDGVATANVVTKNLEVVNNVSANWFKGNLNWSDVKNSPSFLTSVDNTNMAWINESNTFTPNQSFSESINASNLIINGRNINEGITSTGKLNILGVNGTLNTKTIGSSISIISGAGSDENTTGDPVAGGSFTFASGKGGSKFIPTGGTGATGGAFVFTSGVGGNAVSFNSITQATSGAGGAFTLTSGSGGNVNITGTSNGQCANSGPITIQTGGGQGGSNSISNATGIFIGGGSGTVTINSGTVSLTTIPTSTDQRGGVSGALQFFTSAGGTSGFALVNGSGIATGGKAGDITFVGGQGGGATSSFNNTGGNGASIFFTAGAGGIGAKGNQRGDYNRGGNGGDIGLATGLGGSGVNGTGLRGNLLIRRGTTTQVLFNHTSVQIVYTMSQLIQDNFKMLFGTSGYSSMYGNVSDTIINPKETGTGKLYVLGDTNNQNDLTTGNFSLSDTNWDDVTVPFNALADGIQAPQFDENQMAHYFEDKSPANLEQYAFGSAELPHGWKLETALHPHIHLHPSSTNVGNATFMLNYTWTNIGAVEQSGVAIYMNVSFNGTANLVQIPEFPDLNGTGKTLSSVVEFRLQRLSASASDTFTGNVYVDNVGFHYEISQIGSRQELVF